MIAALVQQVGKEFIAVHCLIDNQLDPHSYELVKGDGEKLARADVIFYNGAGLEHGASLLQYFKSHTKAISIADKILEQKPDMLIIQDGQRDPHLWMDLELWALAIPSIVEQCALLDPLHAEEFEKNGNLLSKQLLAAHHELLAEMSTIQPAKRYLVTSHDAFRYFTRAYLATPEERISGQWEERCMAPEGLAPESQISVQQIALLIEQLQQHDVHVLFFESNVSRASLNKILDTASKKGLELTIADKPLYGDAMGPICELSGEYPGMVLYDGQLMHSYWSQDVK